MLHNETSMLATDYLYTDVDTVMTTVCSVPINDTLSQHGKPSDISMDIVNITYSLLYFAVL